MHHPISLLWLSFFAIFGLKYQYLLKSLHNTIGKNSSSFSCFAPSCFNSFFISVNLSSFPCSCCVCFGRPMKKVTNLTIFANSCNILHNLYQLFAYSIHFKISVKSIYILPPVTFINKNVLFKFIEYIMYLV
jgi:hypothetical protein